MAVGGPPGWGLSPESFWNIGPEEWWLMFDARRTDKVAGSNLTEAELADLYDLIKDS